MNRTPGPYKQSRHGGYNIVGGTNERLVANCGGYSSNYEDSDAENKANFEFILKACNNYDSQQSLIAELVAMIEVIQWSGDRHTDREGCLYLRCPSCNNLDPVGHKPDCTLNKLIKKAKGVSNES